MLRIKENEELFVERIVEGLTPTQRAHFVFQAPSSFLHLEQLAVVDPNIAYAEQMRNIQPAAGTAGVVETQRTTSIIRYSHAPSQRTSRPSNTACFHCRKPGHIQKVCRLRLAQLRKPEPIFATSQP